MTHTVSPRVVRVGCDGGALIRVLAEHRTAAHGWRIEPLGFGPADMLEAEALVLLDFDDADAQRTAVDSVRSRGFAGRVMILGDRGGCRSSDDEPIPRPVRLGVLLARLDAHWVRAKDAARVALGPYAFLPDEAVLLRADDEDVRLTELECRLLNFLAEAEGGLVPREQLLAGVWGYTAGVDTHTVETHIWRLRQKVETDDPATHFLVTEAGGYRLLIGERAG